MIKSGINLREDTFNTMMTGALQNDNMQVVPNMFSQLLSLNLRPDSLSYTALITALARLSRPEAAVSQSVFKCKAFLTCKAYRLPPDLL